jgi:putative peptidoglycan lipid II flippase
MDKLKENQITHFAKHFFYGTLISRFFGLLRDVLMAFYFGSSAGISSFMVAYRLSNLFRRLLGEGTINSGFIPHFESLQTEDKQKAYNFYRDLLFSLAFVLIVLIINIELILSIVKAKDEIREITQYIMIMFVGLIFICLYALNSAFLNCHKRFFLSAVAPVVFNLVFIITIFYVQKYQSDSQIIQLAYAVVIGYFLQFLLTHFLAQRVYHQNVLKTKWIFPGLFSKQVRIMIKPLTYSIIGVSAIQINSAVDTIFAKIANSSGPAYLWYAIRLQQLPLALFSIAVSSAILPFLSKSLQSKNFDLFRSYFNKGIDLSFTLMIISTFGIFALGGFSINLIYGRGDFNSISLFNTFKCLMGYSVGLIPQTLVIILACCFYAKKDYKTPALTSLISVILNIFLNSFFVFTLKMDTFFVAIATSLSAILNAYLLAVVLKKQYSIHIFQYSFIKTSVVAICAFIISQTFKNLFFKEYLNGLSNQVLQFFIMAIIFFGSVIFIAKIANCKEILSLIKKTPSRLKGF